jgi:hypothetical protein
MIAVRVTKELMGLMVSGLRDERAASGSRGKMAQVGIGTGGEGQEAVRDSEIAC